MLSSKLLDLLPQTCEFAARPWPCEFRCRLHVTSLDERNPALPFFKAGASHKKRLLIHRGGVGNLDLLLDGPGVCNDQYHCYCCYVLYIFYIPLSLLRKKSVDHQASSMTISNKPSASFLGLVADWQGSKHFDPSNGFSQRAMKVSMVAPTTSYNREPHYRVNHLPG